MSTNLFYLAFDFGMKHLGIAIGQSITQTASPLKTLTVRDGVPNWLDIDALIHEWQPEALIVGYPLNMDGTVQTISYSAKKFANRLKHKTGLPVHLVDERLTTWEAKNRLGKFSQSTDLHSRAAVLILEQWFSDQPQNKTNHLT